MFRQLGDGGETYFVGEEDGKILGFSSLKDDIVRALYVTAEGVGRKVGRQLYEAVESLARQRGVSCLRLDSSLTAEGIYDRMGYQVIQRCERQLSSGVRLPCILMTKTL